MRLTRKQAIAITIEIGVHNGTMAIFIASELLHRPTMAIPPAVYSLIMFMTSAVFGYWVTRGVRKES